MRQFTQLLKHPHHPRDDGLLEDEQHSGKVQRHVFDVQLSLSEIERREIEQSNKYIRGLACIACIYILSSFVYIEKTCSSYGKYTEEAFFGGNGEKTQLITCTYLV